MQFHLTFRQSACLTAAATILLGFSFTGAAEAAPAGGGWVRLGDLSETLSPVDIYLVSSSGATVAKEIGVSYGSFPKVLTLPVGTYTVDVRDVGASPTSTPAASAKVTVQANTFYTVAPVEVTGQGSTRRIVDLPDSASTPAGDASVQAIDAAYLNGDITFNCAYTGNTGPLLDKVTGGTAASDDMPAGTWTETATGSNGKTTSQQITLAANTTRTEIVLDTTSGLQVLNLLDTVGGQPTTSVITGFGPPPEQGPGSPLPWLALIGAGALLAATAGTQFRRRSADREQGR